MPVPPHLVPLARLRAAASVAQDAGPLDQALAIVRLLRAPAGRLAALDPATRFYTRVYWMNRLIAPWEAAHGPDAGLRQQAFQLLEDAPEGVDWQVVEQVLAAAAAASEAPG